MNILIQKPPEESSLKLSQENLDSIKKIIPSAKITISDSLDTTNNHIENADIIIPANISDISKLNFLKAKKLKWVHVTSAGINTLPKELVASNVLITNSSGVHPIPISEHVFAFILMFARQINKSHRIQIQRKKWIRDESLFGITEVQGRTIGIIGLGRIGKRVAMLGKAFSMKVLAVQRKKTNILKNIDKSFNPKDIDKVIEKSDFVINCLPATRETYHLFDYKKFSKMKKTAYFINIGRGITVNENDLIKALNNNLISGAGLDVFEEEPLSEKSPLWSMDNVIITPHYSGMTPFYMDRVVKIFCENATAFLKGSKMPNLVDKKRGY